MKKVATVRRVEKKCHLREQGAAVLAKGMKAAALAAHEEATTHAV
jgi:hypothetical protein